ncbi:MAG: pilus assembly protein PilZ [Treponema sp.]|jgi:hypothetical protein|nr:pilus assembly protein PilZ [Treponema sp.]
MIEQSAPDFVGRKIFFLYPSRVMLNGVAEELIQQEYEVYKVRDHEKMRNVLKQFPESIVFVNIDEGMSEKDWEAWIRGIMKDPATAKAEIGILTATANETLGRKYINTVRIQCGFTVVKTDAMPAARKLYAILQSVNARGRRKYIRVNPESEFVAMINIPHNGRFIEGVIKDISVVGLSCTFNEDPALEKNSLCRNMQIKLGSTLLKAEGIVFGSRDDKFAKIYVFLFTQRTDPDIRTKIRKFNQSVLQSRMDAHFK